MNFGSGSSGRLATHGSTSSGGSTAPFIGTPSNSNSNISEMGEPPARSGSRASSSAGGPFAATPSQRKERGAIAAQACDTCRSRKQKCDEQRPQCSTCQKFKLACHYREPQPTKKDKTLGKILDRLNSLEQKIDILGAGGGSGRLGLGLSTALEPSVTNTMSDIADLSSLTETPGNIVDETDPMTQSMPDITAATTTATTTAAASSSASASASDSHYRYSPAVYQMMGWPVVRQLLAPLKHRGMPGVEALAVEHEAQAFILGLHHKSTGISTMTSTANPASTLAHAAPSLPPWDVLYRLSNAYFDTFNCIAPIVDRTAFLGVTLPMLLGSGSGAVDDRNIDNITLVFLVMALGEVALSEMQGSAAHPLRADAGPPPGLDFFNEARRRMGFVLGDCSLEAVQVHALAGKPSELTSPRADLVRRIFWYCLIIETQFNIELGLPPTGLEQYEHVVGLPDFSGPYSQADYLANQASHFQEHYASQIVLRRLCAAFHSTLSATNEGSLEASRISRRPTASSVPATPLTASSTTDTADMPPSFPVTARQMGLQLEGWRGMLPQHLRWQESEPAEFPNAGVSVTDSTTTYGEPIFSPPAAGVQTQFHGQPLMASPAPTSTTASNASAPPTPSLPAAMFSSNLDPSYYYNATDYRSSNNAPSSYNYTYPYALDLQVAILRTRYYYTKCLVHKPFLYKALHHPDQLSHDDAIGAAACLQACLRWPLIMAPTCARKRLIPCLFFVTQNILGTLLILRLAQEVPILIHIKSLCEGGDKEQIHGADAGQPFDFDVAARETMALCMAWLRDLRSIDHSAEWAYEIVKGVYHIEE